MQSAGQRRKFIVDTDAGVDDAVAIMLLLSTVRKTPIDIVAFTSVQGNVNVDQVTTNIGRLLDIAGTTVPFYKGACEPVLGKHVGCIHWEGHGKDGLGDALALPKSDRKPEAEHAASAIVRLVHAHPNELTIILLGPMTNLAVALKLDPSIANKIKEVYFIGGTTEGRGNQTMVAEFNIHSDPEAADIVLSSMPPGTLTMISWELTEYNTLPWAWYDEWLKMEHTAKLNKTMEQIMALTVRLSQKPHSWPPVAPGMNICDAVCMAVAMYPDISTKAETRFVAVELAGTYTRGMTCIDWYSHTKNKANVRIVLTVDHSRYQAILKGMFTT